jgi:hypothetical protein
MNGSIGTTGGGRIGMLWFDNHPVTKTIEKIRKAVAFYARKNELRPTWVEMHAGEATEAQAAEIERELGLRIILTKKCLPSYFWMGVD